MNWLLEDPTIAVFVMIAGIGLGWAGWSQTGETRWLSIGGLVAVVGLAFVLLELAVKTDPEQINETLQRMASACERQDVGALLAEIDPNAATLRANAETALTHYRVTRMKLSDVQVAINSVVLPLEARVEVVGTIHGAVRFDRAAEISGVARERFRLKFRKSEADGRWRCLSATWENAGEGYGE
ncbi:MAG TPA: hypothetical protein VGE52_13540 [Pirellulales bacterium]